MHRLDADGDCVCLNSDTDVLTSCLIYNACLRECRGRVVLVGAMDPTSKNTDMIQYKHVSAVTCAHPLNFLIAVGDVTAG